MVQKATGQNESYFEVWNGVRRLLPSYVPDKLPEAYTRNISIERLKGAVEDGSRLARGEALPPQNPSITPSCEGRIITRFDYNKTRF